MVLSRERSERFFFSLDIRRDPLHNRPSMRTIAFMNQKGGVGKTTTAVNIGSAMARRGKRVCMIDLDPQAHLTINFGIEHAENQPTIYDVLVTETGLADAAIAQSDKLAVLPANIDLAGAEIELVSIPGRDMILREKLEALSSTYDYVLIDCPPSLGLLTINALVAADTVLIPMLPHFLALQGMARLLDTIKLIQRRLNPRLTVLGTVLTMFDPQAKLSHEVVAELDRFFGEAAGQNLPWSAAKVFETRIRRNIKLAESPSFGKPIFDYDPGSNGAADYTRLADEILATLEPAVGPASGPATENPPATAIASNADSVVVPQ
jgi:chromosome partitioning protein